MSFSFSIADVDSICVASLLHESGFPNLKFSDGTPADPNGQWLPFVSHIYIDKVSVRPIEIILENHHFQLRIMTASGVDEYLLACGLAAALSRLTGKHIRAEDDDASYDAKSFDLKYNKDWAIAETSRDLNILVDMYKVQQQELTIAGVHADLTLGKRFITSLQKEPALLVEHFFERFRMLNYLESNKYNLCNNRIVENAGKEWQVANYTAGSSSIFKGDTDVVVLEITPGHKQVIEFDKFVNFMADDAIWLSEKLLLVMDIGPEKWRQRTGNAGNHIVPMAEFFSTKNKAVASKPVSALRAKFSEEQWHEISLLPVIVFMMIAGEKGKIAQREFDSMAWRLKKLRNGKSELMNEVVKDILPRLTQIFKRLSKDKPDLGPMLAMPMLMLPMCVDDKLATEYKQAVYDFASTIVCVSSFFFGLFVSKQSKLEMKVLASLKDLFEL